jgi:hypothetical protein
LYGYALVGAVPPLMGWAAARGALEPAAGVLAAALYFWQMPHFMALATTTCAGGTACCRTRCTTPRGGGSRGWRCGGAVQVELS